MTHEQKVAYLASELQTTGINPKRAAPPLIRLLWATGWYVRPPHFQSFLNNVLSGLLIRALVFGSFTTLLFLWLGFLAFSDRNLIFLLVFGIYVLWSIFRWAGNLAEEARKLNLPAWEDYPRRLPQGADNALQSPERTTQSETGIRAKE
jgi:hypothetical protein